MHARTQEKGAVTLQGTDSDLPVSVQESMVEVWVCGGLLQGQGCLHGTFEGGCNYLHYLHHSLAPVNSSTRQQKIGLKIYWAWPCPSEQDPVCPSVSLSHLEASINLLSFSIRGQTENHSHRKLTNLITWTTALSNSMKLWAMPCRATQDRWIMVESSDKMWSTGEENGKPLQSCKQYHADL